MEVRYLIRGIDPEAGLEGEMSVLLGVGGHRRELWELRSTAPGSELATRGSTIASPEKIWSQVEGGPAELMDNQLAGFALAYLQLDPKARAAVVAAIREWQRMLARQRREQPGELREVAGVECLQTRIAAQNLCLWEQTGLFLRYEGAAFSIEASAIDFAPTRDLEQAFKIPAAEADTERLRVEALDHRAALEELAHGNYASLAQVLAPGLRLPKLLPREPG